MHLKENNAWLTKGMDETDKETNNGGLLAKFLRLATVAHLIPLERSSNDQQLSFHPLSPVSLGSLLVWRMLPTLVAFSCLCHLWFNNSLWDSFEMCINQTLLLTTTDTISHGLSLSCFAMLDICLPSVLAALLVKTQDAVPIDGLTWPRQMMGNSVAWQPLVAILLIPTLMVLEVTFMLLPWLTNFADITLQYALGLFVWFYGPLAFSLLMALILLVAAELLATQCMTYLNQKVDHLVHQSEVNESILDAAELLLINYQHMCSALEPISFLIVCSTTLLLVLDLFYCTDMRIETWAVSLVFLHLLAINMALLYHFCISADNCYSNFKSVLGLLR
jgi:hypothetical protein